MAGLLAPEPATPSRVTSDPQAGAPLCSASRHMPLSSHHQGTLNAVCLSLSLPLVFPTSVGSFLSHTDSRLWDLMPLARVVRALEIFQTSRTFWRNRSHWAPPTSTLLFNVPSKQKDGHLTPRWTFPSGLSVSCNPSPRAGFDLQDALSEPVAGLPSSREQIKGQQADLERRNFLQRGWSLLRVQKEQSITGGPYCTGALPNVG